MTINDNPPIWIEDASFVVISVVAGWEQSVASLSIGGRHLSGMSKTWANASLAIGDHLAIICQSDNLSPKGGCSGNQGAIPKFGNGNISGFALNVEGEDATLIEISAHDLVQVVGTWDAVSDVFNISLNAMTSNREGTIDDDDGLILEQPSGTFRPIHIRIV
ncbi:hypothetical protein FHW69_003483 [Luteibacter sp. Sphag1AF]|uniref:hypothetical protein n=1 Tax=Luteibacter sp. Sphag1AF TaxID=2587031 RepID=UPI00161E7230|nr:hypothetical protein [Luteibacter sp. Sphag1AF]MBB3228838.1 hypothetical protein [Luteibacter sp. Sphag1AF]